MFDRFPNLLYSVLNCEYLGDNFRNVIVHKYLLKKGYCCALDEAGKEILSLVNVWYTSTFLYLQTFTDICDSYGGNCLPEVT